MSAKRHDSDECPAAGAIATGNSSKHFTQDCHTERVPSSRYSTIRQFNRTRKVS